MEHNIYYIIGVSGSGKSTIGMNLAKELNCPYLDGDDFHTEKNIAKMKSGLALTDSDRLEWLLSLNQIAKKEAQKSSIIISCSALKESYRQLLQKEIKHHCMWIYLKGDFNTILNRIRNRNNHFMPSDLLQSQFDILEEPTYGIHIDTELSIENIIQIILQQIDK